MAQQQRAALLLRALRAATASTSSSAGAGATTTAAAAASSSAPRLFAAKAGATAPSAPPAAKQKDWSAVAIPAESAHPPTTVGGGQAFANDVRSTSGLCAADGITQHTAKWLQPSFAGAGREPKSPMQWIREAEPIEVHAPVVASTGSDDPALGCPVEYINLKGTTREAPAVCKYTGNRFWAPKEYWGGH